MRVLFDGRMYQGKMHGLARYVYATLEAMAKMKPQWDFGVLQNGMAFADLADNYSNIIPISVKSKPFSLLEHWELPPIIENWTPALFHATSIAVPLVIKARLVATVPDLTMYHYPKRFIDPLYFKYILRPNLVKAKRIIVYSNHTALDLSDTLNISKDKIRTVTLGVSENLAQTIPTKDIEHTLSSLNIKAPYVLCVSNPKPHKNLKTLIKAWKMLSSKEDFKDKAQLVIVSSSSPELEALLQDCPNTLRLSNIDDTVLAKLYRGGKMLVMPSIYEGFGLPCVEAMKTGLPVIAANAASLPEIVSQSGILFSAQDAEELKNAIGNLLQNEEECQKLAEKGLEQSSVYTWENCAKMHIDTYMEAINK